MFEEYSEKNHSELPPLTIIQGSGTIRRDESDRAVQYDMNSLSNYKMVNKDDFIVHLRSFEGGLEKANSKGIISPAYHTFSGENTDTTFYYTYFRSEKFIESDLKPHVYGIRDGRSIDVEGMKSINIPYTIFDDQNRIGEFIDSINHLITLHQRKLEKLKIIKKSMLENLFPQNGEKTPKIRFSGFTKDWEQRKLGEVADIIGGGTPSTLNSDYWDGNIDWYSPAEIIDQIYVYKSHRKITELGLEKSSAKMLPVGTVLFTSRAGIGKTAILAKRGCTNQGFQSIVPYSNTLDSYFIFSRTEELKKYGELVGAGSTFVEVSGRQMENMQLMIPKTIGEQHIIGLLFSTLDHLITLHQSKLEKLQKIKKSMLESMFV